MTVGFEFIPHNISRVCEAVLPRVYAEVDVSRMCQARSIVRHTFPRGCPAWAVEECVVARVRPTHSSSSTSSRRRPRWLLRARALGMQGNSIHEVFRGGPSAYPNRAVRSLLVCSSMNSGVTDLGVRALTWALAHEGTSAYATRCLAFVEDAIERPNGIEIFGGDYAAQSARLYEASLNTGSPPIHALAFYESVGELFGVRRDWGHVGMSLGDGRVVHAWDRVRIDEHRVLEGLAPAAGWQPLRWVGWVSLDRVLEGARPRTWDEDAADAAVRTQAQRFGQPDRRR
jgi:hypothetical protein